MTLITNQSLDSFTNEQGYITLATGRQKYVEMALNLALSIKLKDRRPISLLCDEEVHIPEIYKSFFDKIISLRKAELIGKYANKFLLIKYSPYPKSMYIDSDCIMISKNISRLWTELAKYNFAVKGKKFSGGSMKPWSNKKKENVLAFMKENDIEYAVTFIGGSIYFDKSDISRKIFGKAFSIYKEKGPVIGSEHGTSGEFAEERFIGLAMGLYHLEPFPFIFGGILRRKQWINETNGANDYSIDVMRGKCSYRFGLNRTLETPMIAHFNNGLKPREIYLRESNKLREYFALPPCQEEHFF